ncbi:ROK family transcriptional regulator [uncultured Cohaesibacter sp.]|uniref:ROK family transcriptional regulator n=1 Tax=uncultured Cohaesibacter sp. TaxID=1002546 RepID=UPI0029C744A0|nr:ROK family transcriptional regulator [uncultured Cohaesibacter sp.]
MQSTVGKILSVLRDQGTCSRAELARTIGLSTAAISKFTSELLDVEVVREIEVSGKQTVGRPSIDLALQPDAYFMIGAHITVGRVEVVMTDILLQQISSAQFDISRDIEIDILVGGIVQTIEDLIAKSGRQRSRIRGVGLAVPGAVDVEGRINLFSNFTQWSNIPFADLLEARLNLPVTLEHNAAAIALAESRYGAGRERERVLYVYMGGGIGAGITYSRERVANSNRGRHVELGHIVVDPHGAPCKCGKPGCLETVFSEGPLLAQLGLDKVPASGLIDALMQTDGWEERYEQFLQTMATTAILLLPDMIVLGGHLGAAPEAFYARLEEDLAKRILVPQQRNQLHVVRTSYLSDAGAIGAACAGLEQFIFGNPQFSQNRSRVFRGG